MIVVLFYGALFWYAAGVLLCLCALEETGPYVTLGELILTLTIGGCIGVPAYVISHWRTPVIRWRK